MALNLSRDVRMVVSEVETGHNASNSFEVRVLDGFSFNQATDFTDITIEEGGAAPARGMRRFNTALNPVDISFSTYVRPYMNGTNHDCIERILWEALAGADTFGTNAVSSGSDVTIDFNESNVHELKKLFIYIQFGSGSDQANYKITEAIMGQVDLDFSLDGIATLAWSGQGRGLQEIPAAQFPASFQAAPEFASFLKNKLSVVTLEGDYARTSGTVTLDGTSSVGDANSSAGLTNGTTYQLRVTVNGGVTQTLTHTYTTAETLADIITSLNASLFGATVEYVDDGSNDDLVFTSETAGTNSSVMVQDGLSNGLLAALNSAGTYTGWHTDPDLGSTESGTGTSRNYSVPITGGNISINNNITFLTPEELGIVNRSIGHFTGTRDISGNLTAYLRSGGATDTSALIEDLLKSTDEVTTSFDMSILVGGSSAPNLEFSLPQAHLTIPSIETEDVMSVSIEFAGLGTGLDQTDEATIIYKAS